MRRRWRLELAYDGSGFAGWQMQPGLRTVQGELEGVFGRLGEGRRPVGAGRTDAGVHALRMIAHVDLTRAWSAQTLARALRAELPRDIALGSVRGVAGDFHARFDARSRTYHYALALTDNPFFRSRRWTVPVLPAAGWIQGELASLELARDFRAVARSGGSRETLCRIRAARWCELPGGAVFEVTADRFLHGMVRTLVGALVRGHARGARRGHLARLLAAERRMEVALSAPACGLYLSGVTYRGEPVPAPDATKVAVLAGLTASEDWLG